MAKAIPNSLASPRVAHTRRRFHLTRLEAATGILAGTELTADEAAPQGEESPRAALERIVLDALLKPPCVVSFSGGRDSSAILALATRIARREGVAPPIASTLRFAASSSTHESEWQELVIRHLSLKDWVIQEITDELDCVGPVARPILRRHGLLWPMNSHFMVLHASLAAAGTLLTGAGGDQLLTPSRYGRHEQLLRGRICPRPRDLLRLGYAVAPRSVRRTVLMRRQPRPVDLPWLREHARAALFRHLHDEAASEPIRSSQYTTWTWRSRALQVGMDSLSLVIGDEGTRPVHPFLEPRFVRALAQHLRLRGPFADRSAAMLWLFGDLLPRSLAVRRTKASFDDVFWNRHTHHFLRSFDGTGVDEELVDAAALRRCWLKPSNGRAREMLPLQAAWLAADRRPSRSERSQALE
jgi:asparagine synthetase B (glutamine-hydrolysing)